MCSLILGRFGSVIILVIGIYLYLFVTYFIFRAFSILHFAIYVDNACVAKTTKFSELRKLLPTNDAQGNPTRGTAQARSRGPSPFRGRAHPRSRGGPRAAKMGTKICYQGSWASQIASHEWVLKFVIKVVGQDYQVVISWAFLPPPWISVPCCFG